VIGAPEARILWRAEIDPGTLQVIACPIDRPSRDAVDLDLLKPWLTTVAGSEGREHAVLSDGRRRIRLDVLRGSLALGGMVLLHYRLRGVRTAEHKLLPLNRLLTLCRAGSFAPSLFPRERRLHRWIDLLRVADALADGSTYQDIAIALFGRDRVARDWNDGGRSLHSRVRRLVAGARRMAGGGYRDLLRPPND
jgi:hypothetical protein